MRVCSVCVWWFVVSFTYAIESIDSKLISGFLFNDYLLIADLHIFIYGSAECAIISLECTKVKLLISNNFALCIILTSGYFFFHGYFTIISTFFCSNICNVKQRIEQKGMTFDHGFGYSFPPFSSLLEKEGRRKGEWIAKIVIKSQCLSARSKQSKKDRPTLLRILISFALVINFLYWFNKWMK